MDWAKLAVWATIGALCLLFWFLLLFYLVASFR